MAAQASWARKLHAVNDSESFEIAHLTSGQVALAWLLHQDDHTVPIPSTRRIKYLEENIGAASVTLSPADLADIGRFLAEHPVAG